MKILKILFAAISVTLFAVSCGDDVNESVKTNNTTREFREIEFSKNQDTWYGFDKVALDDPLYSGRSNLDQPARNPDTRDSVYISVASGGTNTVDVVINGTATALGVESFYVKSTNTDVVNVNQENNFPVQGNATTTITFTAANVSGHRRAQIKVMGVSASGEDVSLRTLNVEVFVKKGVRIHYYKVYDSRSPRSNLSFKPTELVLAAYTNEMLRQAVVDATLWFEEFDIPYDNNGNGVLDAWMDGVEANAEVAALRDAINSRITPTSSGNIETVVHVENARGVWTITNPITRGTNVTLNINLYNSTGTLRNWDTTTIFIGEGEPVKIIPNSFNNNSIRIERINNNYPANTLLWFPIAGVNVGGFNALTTYTNTETISRVMVHELSHGPFANWMDDVNEVGNVMNYQASGKNNFPTFIFRMRPMQGTFTGTRDSNGKNPQRQWLRLQNIERD
ncbi:MAG: hypothetical protein LBI42_15820 [Chitinispirillales bacterium]|jgi:hypothetical protein|nr:hypothetical protein [Chitinispirillales bacterium]